MLNNPGWAAYCSLIFGAVCFALNIATLWVFIRARKKTSRQRSGPELFVQRNRLVENRFTVTAVIMFVGQFVMAIFMVQF